MGLLSETSKDFDPAVCVETTEELLHLLESRSMPPSDVLILDHLKTLLLLQDTERLQSALKMFPEHCAMPPGKYHSIHSRVSPERSVKRYSQDLERNLQRKIERSSNLASRGVCTPLPCTQIHCEASLRYPNTEKDTESSNTLSIGKKQIGSQRACVK